MYFVFDNFPQQDEFKKKKNAIRDKIGYKTLYIREACIFLLYIYEIDFLSILYVLKFINNVKMYSNEWKEN